MPEHPVRRLLRWLLARVLALYFRDVEVLGAPPPATTGGRLLAANHVNALVDPLLVLTSTACVISPVAKSTLWKLPGVRWLLDVAHAVPIVRRQDAPGKAAGDNAAVFARVATHLGQGGNILIFPEGTSHNEPHLVPLRSGAGRMLAQADGAGATGLTVQAVGLAFDERDVFRSRALVIFGEPRPVVRGAGESDDALAARLTAQLAVDLGALVVEAPDWPTRLAIARVASMYADSGALAEQHQLEAQVRDAAQLLGAVAPGRLAALVADVHGYWAALARAGLDDAVVAGRRPPLPRVGLGMLLTLPLALLGVLLYALPYPVPRWLTRRTDATADAVSTYKLGAALVVYPLWIVGLTIAALLLLPGGLALASIAALIITPFALLPWFDRQAHVMARVRALLAGDRRAALAAQRTALMDQLERLRASLG